jgi:hypothetical protein
MIWCSAGVDWGSLLPPLKVVCPHVCRSHIVVEKGGKIKDVRIGISPGDSFAEALKTVMS